MPHAASTRFERCWPKRGVFSFMTREAARRWIGVIMCRPCRAGVGFASKTRRLRGCAWEVRRECSVWPSLELWAVKFLASNGGRRMRENHAFRYRVTSRAKKKDEF